MAQLSHSVVQLLVSSEADDHSSKKGRLIASGFLCFGEWDWILIGLFCPIMKKESRNKSAERESFFIVLIFVCLPDTTSLAMKGLHVVG